LAEILAAGKLDEPLLSLQGSDVAFNVGQRRFGDAR
jgi:hypothetical protein